MADAPRLFIDDDLHEGCEVRATAEQAHYLGHVMRRAPGSELWLFNGRHGEWAARILSARRGEAVFGIGLQRRQQSPEPDLWLAFAPLKRDAIDLLAQKATELGVSVLLPVFTERTNASRVNLDRLRAIAIEAAEQSERLSVPDIRQPVTLPALLAAWPAGRVLACALERGASAPVPKAGALLIGPEGGFSPLERELLERSPHTAPLWLGPRILRAETAAIAGLTLLQATAWAK